VKRRDPVLARRVDVALAQLLDSDDPTYLGEAKVGPLARCFAYPLGDCRILYTVHRDDELIKCHRVCSHKEAYGP